MRALACLSLLGLCALLQGCYTPVIEGAQQGVDGVRREMVEKDAAAGNPEAQYKLGNSYCCQGGGPLHNVSIYDNAKATHWYCEAARQGNVPAQMQLARLYSGSAIRGVHLMLRASAAMEAAPSDPAVALMWAEVAAGSGQAKAIDERDQIRAKATEEQRSRAQALQEQWRSAPCEWAEVFPPAPSAAAK